MIDRSQYPLLETIDEPAALRKLSRRALPQLATELRAFMLASVAKTGGHLSSNLGTVELTVALHYVFDTPRDRLVFDVGHQTYAHKILTGRREAMSRLRMAGGPSGFPRRTESEYDTFGTAHSSTVDFGCARHGGRGAAQGRRAADRRGDRRRRDDGRHGIRSVEQRRRREGRPARDPERQRHVDLGARGCAQQSSRAPLVEPDVRQRAARRQGGAVAAAAGAAIRQALRVAYQGDGPAGNDVRGARFQLHRSDRWS
jgi:hypothetical protein